MAVGFGRRRIEVAHDRHGELVAEAGGRGPAQRGIGEKSMVQRAHAYPATRFAASKSLDIEEVPLADLRPTVVPERSRHPQADVVDAVLSMSAATGRSRTPRNAERRIDRVDSAVPAVVARRWSGRSRTVVVPGGQVVEAVAVEVADDRHARAGRRQLSRTGCRP